MPLFFNDPKRASAGTAVDTLQPSDRNSSGVGFDASSIATEEPPLTLIPWADIWSSLRVARVRGNGEMIEVFYDTLFREAIFDDRGAWSWNINKRD